MNTISRLTTLRQAFALTYSPQFLKVVKESWCDKIDCFNGVVLAFFNALGETLEALLAIALIPFVLLFLIFRYAFQFTLHPFVNSFFGSLERREKINKVYIKYFPEKSVDSGE